MAQLSVDGQYYFDFIHVESGTSIIEQEDSLRNFVLRQRSLNVLPVVKCELLVGDERHVRFLNEGSEMRVVFGHSPAGDVEEHSATFYLSNVMVRQYGRNLKYVVMEGILNRPRYVSEARHGMTTEPVSSIEAVRRVASDHFLLDTNMESTADVQTWVRPSITDRNFVTHVCRHAYVEDSFVATGISALKETLHVLDMARRMREEPKYRLVQAAGDQHSDRRDSIPVMPGSSARVNTAAFNQFAGYRKRLQVDDWDGSEYSDVLDEFQPALASNRNWNRHRDMAGFRQGPLHIRSGNHHPRFHAAMLYNKAQLARYSTFQLNVSVNDRFRDYRPLDLVTAQELELDNGGTTEDTSGTYIVTDVVHRIRGKQYLVSLKLCREAPGFMRGEFG